MPDKDAIRKAAKIAYSFRGTYLESVTHIESIIYREVERELKDAYEAIAMLVAHSIGEMKAGGRHDMDHLPDVIRRLGP